MQITTDVPTNAPPTPTARRMAVRVEGLTKSYGKHIAVDSLDFEVAAGDVVGLLGANGAGKTTAMKMLLGLVAPTAGRIELLGIDATSSDYRHAVRRVGALIENPGLYERLSARQNLELAASALGIRKTGAAEARIDELLDLVSLSDRADDRAGGYSLGMKQRLGIAVAMVGSPELVILDEPANGLDPAGIVEIRHLLRRLPEMGTTVFVSSHQLAEVQLACDRLVVMSHGNLIAAGTTAEILAGFASDDVTVKLDPTEAAMCASTLMGEGISVSRSEINADELRITLPSGWTGRDLNRRLADGGVYVDELTPVTVSLEAAFLQMTEPSA